MSFKFLSHQPPQDVGRIYDEVNTHLRDGRRWVVIPSPLPFPSLPFLPLPPASSPSSLSLLLSYFQKCHLGSTFLFNFLTVQFPSSRLALSPLSDGRAEEKQSARACGDSSPSLRYLTPRGRCTLVGPPNAGKSSLVLYDSPPSPFPSSSINMLASQSLVSLNSTDKLSSPPSSPLFFPHPRSIP